MHKSIKLNQACEFVNVTAVSPLISKCHIKVCYVQDTPNRNNTVITKEVAKKFANTLPGCPIVGFYNTASSDFLGHEETIEVSNGIIAAKPLTKPYGFVDLNAKIWFQIFLDDDSVEREYLMTEGYLWTGQYPESKSILEGDGKNQSLEFHKEGYEGQWAKDINGRPQFFIVNEAIIENLCILGESVEPCFEGASITSVKFSLEENFKEELVCMMNQLKEISNKGGIQLFTKYSVEIGDTLWSALYRQVREKYDTKEPDGDYYSCKYDIDGIYEEGTQKFAILKDRSTMTYFRLDFFLNEITGLSLGEDLIDVTKTFTPAAEPQFDPEAVKSYEETYAAKKVSTPLGESAQTGVDGTQVVVEGACNCGGECGTECACNPKKKKKKYSLEEIPEYVELQTKYNSLLGENQSKTNEIEALTKFKLEVELESKQSMISKFYMLNDEDKADVVSNINTYSLDEIESKLSVICVRNKVSFDEETLPSAGSPVTFSLEPIETSSGTPAWIKAAESVASRKR